MRVYEIYKRYIVGMYAIYLKIKNTLNFFKKKERKKEEDSSFITMHLSQEFSFNFAKSF